MLRPRRSGERGASAVEFALVLLPLLIIVFGLIQYGLYFWAAQSGSHTANAAARQLSVGNCNTNTKLRTFVVNRLGAANSGTVTVSRTYRGVTGAVLADQTPANAAVGGTVEVRIEFPTIDLNFPFVPFLSDPTVVRQVVARVEDTTEETCPT